VSQPALDAALEDWRRSLPPEAVLTGSELDPYHINCLSLDRVIPAALRPTSEADVLQIVQIARRHKTRLYAFSTGHNWGYGTALPVADNCVLVDLSRMNRILSMDPDLGLVTLEPGVTQKQLYDYLAERGLDFFVPTTGAGPTASVLANALERGFGMTPIEDHFAAVTSLRAVLANGTVYQPYMSGIGATTADGVYKWGLGPYLDGLFTQSNFGIVTSAQIALVRRPEHTEVFLFTQQRGTTLAAMVDACREMMADLRGPLGGVKFLNRKQVENTFGVAKVGPGFPEDYDWAAVGVLHGTRAMVPALRKGVRRGLQAQVSALRFVNDEKIVWLRRLGSLAPGSLKRSLLDAAARVEQVMHIMHGNPRGLELRLAYRYVPLPKAQPWDPVRDGVGIFWYAPVLPLKGEIITRLCDMAVATLGKYGFDQTISFTTLSERCAIGVVPIIYRKTEAEETKKAHECFHTLWREGEALGCPPYRINIAAMPELSDPARSVYFQMVQALKSALDPDDILSPGRYGPS